jgi:hypothetical protein
MNALGSRQHMGSGRRNYGNVARCRSRPARFGATLLNPLAVRLNSVTAQDHMSACSVVVKNDTPAPREVSHFPNMKRHRATALIGIMEIAGLMILVPLPIGKLEPAIPTVKVPGAYPYETPVQVPAPPPVSDSSPLPSPAPFPYPESSSSLSPSQDRDSRIADTRRPLTARAVREAAFKYYGVANFCGFLAALPADVSVFDPKLGRTRALVKGGRVIRKNVAWLRKHKQAAAHEQSGT